MIQVLALLLLHIIFIKCTLQGLINVHQKKKILPTKDFLCKRNHHKQLTITDLHIGEVSHYRWQILASYILKTGEINMTDHSRSFLIF